jgi:glycosyltransferase involved in cell wall biosynthesis
MREITIFCPTIGVGGVEKNLYLILNYFAKKNLNVNLLTCSFEKKKKLDNRINIIGPKNNFFNKNFQIIKIIVCFIYFFKTNLIKKKTILFSFQSNVYAILIANFFNLKIITRINASPDIYLKNPIKKYVFSKIYKLSDCVIVNSIDLNKKVNKYLKVKSEIIYNPVFNKKKNLLALKRKIPKRRNKTQINLLNVGRLVHQKNQILLVKAMKFIKLNSNLKFKLIIIGNGDLYDFLIKEIKKNNLNSDIKIISNITDPTKYYLKTDFFILSSLYEGLPNALIEAISFKKIVISSNCPTGPKEILLDGKAGYLFKNNNYKQLVKILLKISQNKNNSKKKVIAYKSLIRFDEENNCKKYLSIMNKFIYG